MPSSLRFRLRQALLIAMTSLIFAAVPTAQRIQYQAVGTKAMVATAHSLATQAGIDILKKGGNAFDAAVAISATLNVVEPSRSGMGGVGFMTLYVAKTGEVVSLQMTGAAPYAATPDRFKTKRDQEAGYLAGVVPGNFGGWVHLLEKYGTLTLGEVLATATHYAEQGFPVDSYLKETLDDARSNLEIFPTTAKVLVPNGKLPGEGELLVQHERSCFAFALRPYRVRAVVRGRAAVRARGFARARVRAAFAGAGRAVASSCQARNASPTDQACAMQPRGVNGESPSAISGSEPTPQAPISSPSGSRNARAASFRPCTRACASAKCGSSQVQTVPW
jgi:hypothetical protein